MTRQKQAQETVVDDADGACAALCAALATVGITLPSLGVDPVSFADRSPHTLIDLGRCTVATAQKLTAALTGGGTEASGAHR